jgi:chlorophyllide a reductase subunit X
VTIGDVCFKRDGVFAMELGGPEVGRGCGGRGIIHGFETLEKLGFHDWGFDYVLLDFLGDVVCGGFGLPIARDMCQKVIVVGSATTCSRSTSPTTSARRSSTSASSAATSAWPAWSSTRTTAPARRRPSPQRRHPGAGRPFPANEDIRRKSASYEIIGRPADAVGAAVRAAGQERRRGAAAAPQAARRRTQLLGLFNGDAVGRDVVLEPATVLDMCGHARGRQALARSRLRRRLSADAKHTAMTGHARTIPIHPVRKPPTPVV